MTCGNLNAESELPALSCKHPGHAASNRSRYIRGAATARPWQQMDLL